MNLAQLKYFQHLAHVRHYTHAAADLFITQPTLSHAMSTLSEELGCDLFRKNGREIVLTPEGEKFLVHVERALKELDVGVEELKLRKGKTTGKIEIGAVASVRSHYVPAAIKAFRELEGPYVEFELFQGFTGSLSDLFNEGFYDLLIVGPSNIPNTERVLLFYQELAVAARSDNTLAGKPHIRLSDLEGKKVVTYRPGTAVGDLATKFLNDHNAPEDKMHLIRNCDDEVTMGAQVIDDGLVALTIVNSNLPINPKLVILPLRETNAERFYPLYLVYRKTDYSNTAAGKFIEMLKDFQAQKYTRPDYSGMPNR